MRKIIAFAVVIAALVLCTFVPAPKPVHDHHSMSMGEHVGFFATVWAHASHLFNATSGLPHGIPDFCNGTLMPTPTINSHGATLNISTSVSYTCLGIHGTVNITDGATVTADVILVYDDGVLNIGTSGSPVTCGSPPCVQIIGRDTALLSSTDDPEQFGQGLIAFGKVTVYGDSSIDGENPRSILFKSANPTGVRWHTIYSQRADVDIRYAEFADMGRTDARHPLDSAAFSGETLTHYGTDQIGRYTIHMHHVMGVYPAVNDRQFYLVGNWCHDDSKWCFTVHNSHYGLIQNNWCTDEIGSCFVEEDGSEYDNHWIGNTAKRIYNPTQDVYTGMDDATDIGINARIVGDTAMTPAGRGSCVDVGYDPEGRCASAFWLRGIGNVVMDNVIEDARTGIGWWPRCIEVGNGTTGHNNDIPDLSTPDDIYDVITRPGSPLKNFCSAEKTITIPLFPGADTTNSMQIKSDCYYPALMTTGTCIANRQIGGVVSGNVIRRVKHCLESWWSMRAVQPGSARIEDTICEDAVQPIAFFYSDNEVDGITISRSGTQVTPPAGSVALGWFNDSEPNDSLRGHSLVTNFTISGYERLFQMVGQQDQMPNFTLSNGTAYTTYGVTVDYGKQGQPTDPNGVMLIDNVKFYNWDGQPIGTDGSTAIRGTWFIYADIANETPVDVTVTNHQQVSGSGFHFQWPSSRTSGICSAHVTGVKESWAVYPPADTITGDINVCLDGSGVATNNRKARIRTRHR